MALPKVFDELNKRLPLTGGVMTGDLTLNGDPVANLQAVTKQYIDNQIAGGVVAEAGKLSVNAGSATKPIYFDQGIPKVVGNSLNVDISGTAGKVANQLHFTIGGTERGSYDGSSEHTIYVNAYDLNIQGALQYLGRTNIIPASENITLIDGSTITAEHGNVVIYTGDNMEYLYDATDTWIPLGEVTNYSLAPHIHGNISRDGFITNEEGVALTNRLLTSDGVGAINGGLQLSTSSTPTSKFLNENGTWQTVSTANYYHTSGSWNGLKYTATANGGAGELSFTVPTGSKTAFGALKIGDNIGVSSGVISLSSDNVTAALGYTPMRGDRTMNYAGADTDGGSANTVNTVAADSNEYRPVWFSYAGNTKKAAYNDNFRYNPATRNLEVGSITGSAAKLTTARTISLTGDVTGSATFDGSENASITATIGSISRNKLAQDALYSPVADNITTKNITAADAGVTIKNAWNQSMTIIIRSQDDPDIPVGVEVAVVRWCRYDGGEVTVELENGNLVVSGVDNPCRKVRIPDPYTMIALKKMEIGSWLVTGNVEVMS